MGDRGNIVITQNGKMDDCVFLYGHWEGSDLPAITKKVLARGLRLDDESYLARMLFCAMVGDDVTGETGFGISTTPGDNEYPFVVVDVATQTVGYAYETVGHQPVEMYKKWTFKEFVEAPLAKLNKDFEREGWRAESEKESTNERR